MASSRLEFTKRNLATDRQHQVNGQDFTITLFLRGTKLKALLRIASPRALATASMTGGNHFVHTERQ